MTLVELYQSAQPDWANGETARQLLSQTHWFTVNAEFDPKTGDALPQALSAFLAKVAHPKQDGKKQDRLHRITEHARRSVERLLRTLNESPRREHALLPVHAVRELDANSFIKLSNRPGRTIREKLTGKPYLQAVRRYQSVNLPENRLLKAFVVRLAELLELRREILGEAEDDLIPRIHSWLRTDEAQAITRWENLPPNNTLLAHRDYRRVWDSWRRLQTLDDDIARDLSRLELRQKTMARWEEFGRMYREAAHLFAEMPVMFDYEAFSIQTWLPEPLVEKAARKLTRLIGNEEFTGPACVDLSAMRPRFAVGSCGPQVLAEHFLWQRWKRGDQTVDITLFESDAACLHRDAITIAPPDLFFAPEKSSDAFDRAAWAFAERLHYQFRDKRLVWLVPDALNDFELPVVRRNLNARFPNAEPLPRSVAALFEQVDYSRITKDGYPVLVVDSIGGMPCATKLIARFDADLKKHLPETNGYYWERCPPVILSDRAVRAERFYDMSTVDVNGRWHTSAAPERPQFIDVSHLKEDPRIGNFAFCINVADSPVAGGVRLHDLQARAGNIPLWRDQIPELAIKGYINGFYRRFYLVSRGTTIKPIRGLAMRIPIEEEFTLPAGKRFYQFPLFQGENAAELKFSARLDSPKFPRISKTDCDLSLTFHYGDDEPYNLFFVPRDKSFPPVLATWERTIEEIITDAPSPSLPQPLTWDDLRRMPKPDGAETSDLLEWALSAIDRLDRDLFIRPRPRTVGTLTTDWRIDRNGHHFARAKCEKTNGVFIHERSFVEGADYSSFNTGDQLSFELNDDFDGGFSGRRVAPADYKEGERLRQLDKRRIDEIVNTIRMGIYFPFIQIWGDGRSVSDEECPEEFAFAVNSRCDFLAELISAHEIPEAIRRELLFLLCCLHGDTRRECVEWIADQVASKNISSSRAIGFALGDLSNAWQRYIFELLTKGSIYSAVSVCAYAIWRAPRFIEEIGYEEASWLLNSVLMCLQRLQPKQREDGSPYISVRPLELLLGLLRTRASDDIEVRKLLQPHQTITKRLAEQIDRIEEIVAESKISLFSRVQIDVKKPEDVRTPDLLYALRLYLTGDDGANAIHITGVSGADDD